MILILQNTGLDKLGLVADHLDLVTGKVGIFDLDVGIPKAIVLQVTIAFILAHLPGNLFLVLLPAGSTQNRSAAELLTAANARSIFRRMQRDFHYTIVDTPPAMTVTDVGIIGQLCTGVILVVRLHRTDEFAAKRATRLLQVNNVPIVGCLLVGRDAPPRAYGYGYACNYYRYYNYYRDYCKDAENDKK